MVPAPASVSYWLGLLPSLVRPEIRELLVVGLGGGSGVESIPPSVTAIDVIELEPEVVAANRAIAAQRARDPLSDPRVHVHIGDARGALRLTAKRYGAIVSQPSHPWTAGASHLYTREFFAQVRAHLEPDGVFVQWIAFPFLDAALLRSLAATSAEPFEGIAGAARAIASAPDAYARFGVYRIEDFASAWQLDEAGVRALAQGAPLVTDDDNQLAARAANLGRRALDIPTARALFAPEDPLREAHTGLDRDVLLRTIALRGDLPRAKSLVERGDGATRERELGWLELADGKRRGAAHRFAAARSLAPEDHAALVGLVASKRAELRLGPVAEIREAELDAPIAAVIAGWRAESGALAAAIAARDDALAQIAPGDALFREASRLRAAWRIESGDAAQRTEAVSIMERLLTYAAGPEDALLHARAAIEAGQIDAAWGSLERISALAPVGERGRDIARRALALVDRLPEERASGLRDGLLIRSGGLPAGAGDAPFTNR
jgi:hypothetical protein